MVACLGESTGSPAKTDFIPTATGAIRARVFVLCASNHDACLYKFAFLKRPALGTPDDKKYIFFKFEGRPADTRKRELIRTGMRARGVDVHAASEYGVRRSSAR